MSCSKRSISHLLLFAAGIPLRGGSLLCDRPRTKRLVRKRTEGVWGKRRSGFNDQVSDRDRLCQLVSGRDPSSRGRGVTGSKAWTASAIINSVSAGLGAGWWWKTPSWCIWTETTAASTLYCCLTQSSKWKWAVLTQTPDMESASRTSPGRSAVPVPTYWEVSVVFWCVACFSRSGV